MNIRQINLIREIVDYYESSIQYWDESTEKLLKEVIYDKVNYVRGLLNDLEDEIPTERQIELTNLIIDYKHLIKKNEFFLKNLNFHQCDGCSEMNGICDYEHLIKKAQDEIEQICIDRIRGRNHYLKEKVNELVST